MTACTFLSTKWPHLKREGDVLIRASAGRAGDDRASSMGDDELVRSVRAELQTMIGPFGEPREVSRDPVRRHVPSVPRWPHGEGLRDRGCGGPPAGVLPGWRHLLRDRHPGVHRQWPTRCAARARRRSASPAATTGHDQGAT